MSEDVSQSPRRKRLIRVAEVSSLVGMGTTTIYQRMKEGAFPRPVKMGTLVAWVESEIEEWIEARIKARDSESGSRSDTPKAA